MHIMNGAQKEIINVAHVERAYSGELQRRPRRDCSEVQGQDGSARGFI